MSVRNITKYNQYHVLILLLQIKLNIIMKKLLVAMMGLILILHTESNSQPFELEIVPQVVPGMPGIHSYISVQDNGMWVIIGGRTNGLHGWQPNFAFPASTQNTQIFVVDPVNNQMWSAGTAGLSQNIREQITASNHEFARNGDYLYVFGGYGFSTPQNDMITFPAITAIDIPQLITDVVNQNPIALNFRQITEPNAAVTGGNMSYYNGEFYLVFGHKFDGLYNPHNGPSFTQTYTEQIRKFQITDNGNVFTVTGYTAITDTAQFHRRDYNLAEQVFPNGNFGLTAFSGVFKKNVDLPYYDNIDISQSTYTVNTQFQQRLNNYHTAVITMYDSVNTTSYNLFMGGMAQYYYDLNNTLINDSLVPFVSTISLITRDANGQVETVLPYQMPGYLGSNMEFFPAININKYSNDVIKYHDIDTGKVLIGYLFGGIEADYPYVFMQGGGTSWANEKIYQVYLKRSSVTSIDYANPINAFNCFPNPATNHINVNFTLTKSLPVVISIYDSAGKRVVWYPLSKHVTGDIKLDLPLPDLNAGVYRLTLNAAGSYIHQSIVIAE